ncbi:MAG: hypothetical protein IKY02_06245, partial [Lachnospiraceae bacterium]|nr:hypothetical protein [Lachnospiraceae bacterium]
MQEHNENILRELRGTVREKRIANAYLISGGSAEDRLFIAEAFAKMLVTSPADLIRPEQEKRHLFSVDDVRRTITGTAYIKPYGDGKKVYLIENAALMNVQAQNALLKTLEEPPEYVVILLLSPNSEVFLPTILSHSVKLTLSEGEEETSDEETAELLAGVTRVLESGQDMKIEEVIALLNEYKKSLRGVREATEVNRQGAREVAELVRSWYRDVLIVKLGGEDAMLKNKNSRGAIREAAKRLTPEEINEILRMTEEARTRTESNVSFEY